MKKKRATVNSRRWARTLYNYFPDRELMLRTEGKVWFLRVSNRLQIAGLIFVILLSGWGIFSSFSFLINEKIIEAKKTEILRNRLIYRNLLSEVSDYKSKFTGLTQELEVNHGLMLDLVGKNATLQQNLLSAESKLVSSKRQFESKLVSSKRQFESKLVSSKRRQDEIASAKDDLKAKLSSIEQRIHKLNSHNFELKGNLSTIAGSLENALAERNDAWNARERLTENVSELKRNLRQLGVSEKSVIARLTHTTSDEIDNLEKLIKRTGLRPDRLVAKKLKMMAGQGGPFIELRPNSAPSQHLKASITNLEGRLERLSLLKNLLSIMPLSAPMDAFSISSHFGKRRDPINRRWAMHYGLDLGSVRRARVFSTAAGKVTKAGRKGKYGKFIEISHGQGFKTRYGHLHKILVKRGQKVDYRQKIGLLGNTGRSTGPHLHYELLHDGRPMNPWRFIKAGRYVYKNK